MKLFSFGKTWKFRAEKLEESIEEIKNPARGWYQVYTFYAEMEPDWEELTWCFSEEETLSLMLISIQAYREKPLDEGAIIRIEKLIHFFKEKKRDIIMRIVYDLDGNGVKNEPDKFDIVKKHISQLKTVFEKTEGEIFIYQGMLVGSWGEMHTSKFLGVEKMKNMKDELLCVLPEHTFLAVRRPCFYRQLDGDEKLALFDDAILGSDTDIGTFGTESQVTVGWNAAWNIKEELDFEKELCQSRPHGGEAVFETGYEQKYSQRDIVERLQKMGISYLNRVHDEKILEIWKKQIWKEKDKWNGITLYDYIGRHMGYRFVVKKVTIQKVKNMSQNCQITIELENIGFAPIYQECEVYLECQRDGYNIKEALACDVREWKAGKSFILSHSMKVEKGKVFLLVMRKWDKQVLNFANKKTINGRVLLGEFY